MTRIGTLILLLCCVSAETFSQTLAFDHSNKHLLHVSFNPGITYRTIDYSSGEKWVGQKRAASEIPKFGFNAEVTFTKRLAPNVYGRTGLQFMNQGYRTKAQSLDWTSDVDAPTSSRIIISHHHLGIPVEIGFMTFNRGGIAVIAFAGVGPDILLNSSTVLKTYPEKAQLKSKKSVGFSRFGVNTRAGIEVMAKVSLRTSLVAGILFQYSMTSRLTGSDSKEHAYGGYLRLGVARQF